MVKHGRIKRQLKENPNQLRKKSIDQNVHKVNFYGIDRISQESIKYNENQKESIELLEELEKDRIFDKLSGIDLIEDKKHKKIAKKK